MPRAHYVVLKNSDGSPKLAPNHQMSLLKFYAVADNDNKPVRGILMAGNFYKRVIWASRAIPNLELKKYAFQFTFEAVK